MSERKETAMLSDDELSCRLDNLAEIYIRRALDIEESADTNDNAAFRARPCHERGALLREAGRRMAVRSAAPALCDALSGVEFIFARPGESSVDRFERLAEAFYRDTSILAPGKDAPAAGGQPDDDVRRERYDAWIDAKVIAARSALLLAHTGGTES